MEYGLIGKKLGHSFSKTIHKEIGGYDYELVELDEIQFESFMKNPSFKAINVTIPYKEKVIPYLDYISPNAKKINAVNTIINKSGKLYGYNSDYDGLKEMINFFNINIKDKNVLILGTGGTSKTAYHVLKDLNAKNILFVSRSKKENTITYDELDKYYDFANIIVNTTPCEMYPNNEQKIIDIDPFTSLSGVIDVIFNPLKTNLILSSKKNNINCCNGLYMLVAQAFYAIELFLDKALDKELINKTYQKLLKEKENIVLIGMPSSGKSTIGKKLAKKLNRKFYDVDDEIIKVINMDIASFFKLNGEEAFRKIESEVISNISKNTSCIISTGGGSILKKENINMLKQNGQLIFLDRSLDKLITTSSRPLSSSKEKLENLYKQRYDKYLNACDRKVDGNASINMVIKQILEG